MAVDGIRISASTSMAVLSVYMSTFGFVWDTGERLHMGFVLAIAAREAVTQRFIVYPDSYTQTAQCYT